MGEADMERKSTAQAELAWWRRSEASAVMQHMT